ncbi:MAG: fasciclin domain-containing protein [Microcoleaceae cyanobacterium]
MNQQQQRSIAPVTSLIALIAWSSLSVVLGVRAAFSVDRSGTIAQLPTEVIEGVGGDNLASLILSDDRFTILTTVLKTTGLLTQLQQGESLTLFAPTDAAFQALPDRVLKTLMQPENIEQLTNLLKYHLIPGRVTAADLSSGNVDSLQGSPLSVDVGSQQVKVEEATVIEPDIAASNGVIHVIDQVMILPE